jgi:plastocyanin
VIPSQAFADYSSTVITSTTTSPDVGSTTTYLTTTDPNLGPTTSTVRGPDGMLYTTTMVPTVEVDAFRTGRSGPRDLEGYGTMYDLNRGYSQQSLNGFTTTVDLTQNRSLVKLTADALYEPAEMISDGFSRGVNGTPVTQFDALRIDIQTGTTLTFWADTGHHNIVEVHGPVKMADDMTMIDTSRTYSHTFYTPGNYRFVDGFGGGPNEMPGILVHVRGPQRYAYMETTSTVSSIDTTTATAEETTTVIEPTAEVKPIVQVEATKPTPKVIQPQKPQIRDKDLK